MSDTEEEQTEIIEDTQLTPTPSLCRTRIPPILPFTADSPTSSTPVKKIARGLGMKRNNLSGQKTKTFCLPI